MAAKPDHAAARDCRAGRGGESVRPLIETHSGGEFRHSTIRCRQAAGCLGH